MSDSSTSSSTPRVLQVVTDKDRRGAQVFAVDLHHEFERIGVEVTTVALAPGANPKLDLPVLAPSRRHPRAFTGLRRRARRADVAVEGSTTLPVCAIALLGTDIPFVYRQISDSIFWADDPRRMAQTRWALGRAAGVVALWRGSADVLSEHFAVAPEKIDIIPNGVTADDFWPASPTERTAPREWFGLDADRTTLLYIGALAHEKSVDRAIRAVAGRDDVQLLIAGAGPEEVALRRLASDPGPRRVRRIPRAPTRGLPRIGRDHSPQPWR